jgi:enoyl-CoA hydratase/carnithine racemase
MEEESVIEYDVRDARATITISEPERRNPLTNAAMDEVQRAVRAADSDPDVRVIVLTGAGKSAFSAGGDLGSGFMDDPLRQHASRGALADLFRQLRRCGKPTIARVNGHALGGGFGLAAACDIVVAVEDALLGTPEMRVGLWPMMITAVLAPIVPQKALFEMMATGRRISAHEGHALGVVSRVVARDDLDTVVDAIAAELISLSPSTMAIGKHAFYAVADMDFDAALDHLQMGLTAVGMTEDAAEGVAAFTEKRPAKWSGEQPR